MRKETIRQILVTVLLTAVLVLPFASCSNDIEGDTGNDNTVVNMSLTFQTREISSASDKEYVPGSEYENYINVPKKDYRFYFFTYDPEYPDDEAKYIASFNPSGLFVTAQNDDYTTYRVTGIVPEELLEYKNFKVVMLANWGVDNYPDDKLDEGKTTIDDICEPVNAIDNPDDPNLGTFAYKTTDEFVLSADNLIPFFGVNTYENVNFESGKVTSLDGDLTLLRAMAKVEVILEPNEEDGTTPDITFSSVNICHYNERGYCAPYGIYKKSDYDHNGDWASDFVGTLHLVTKDADGKGINDDQTGHEPLLMYKTKSDEGYEMWVAYVPEYDNTSEGADYSYIEIMTSDQTPYKIYFANYNLEGTTDAYDEGGNADDRYDIYRNYLYRFKVSISKGYLRVKPQPWEAEWENDFEFGSTSTY